MKRRISWHTQITWWLNPRRWLRTILMLDDTPHSIALGTALGVFVAITPTVGLQMILVLLLAILTRPLFNFNRIAALVAVYVSNPLTMVPLYYFNYWIGTLFSSERVSRQEFAGLLEFRSFQAWWESLTAVFVTVGVPLLVGSLIVATVSGLLTYPAMLWLVKHEDGKPRT